MHFRRLLTILSVMCVSLAAGSTAFAQSPAPKEPAHWGVAASVAPWRANGFFKGLYEAQALDLSGGEIRFGVTRGSTRGGEWSLLFVRKTIKEGGTMTDPFGDRYVMGPDVVLTGVMAETFGAFVHIANRAEIGLVLGGGVARVSGTVRQVPNGTMVDPKTILTFFAKETPVQFLGRAELAVAIAAAPGMKIRFSGGLNWPGSTRFSVTALYFFGEK